MPIQGRRFRPLVEKRADVEVGVSSPSHGGFQGEGGVGDAAGRGDGGAAGGVVFGVYFRFSVFAGAHPRRNPSGDKQVKLVSARGYPPVLDGPEFRPFSYSVRR